MKWWANSGRCLCALTTVLLVATACESRPTLASYLADMKSYLMAKAKAGLVSRSAVLSSFQGTMNVVKGRFEQAKKDGKLADLTEEESAALYYQIVSEEVHNLRLKIESDKTGTLGKLIGEATPVDLSESGDNTVGGTTLSERLKSLPESADPEVLDMDMELDDRMDEWEMINEMDHYEQLWLDDAEYGQALDEESLNALRMRSKHFMQDLMANELRQLATAIVVAYSSGVPILPAAVSILMDSKHKFFDYFVNCIMDLLSAFMGRRVEIIPPEILELDTDQAITLEDTSTATDDHHLETQTTQ